MLESRKQQNLRFSVLAFTNNKIWRFKRLATYEKTCFMWKLLYGAAPHLSHHGVTLGVIGLLSHQIWLQSVKKNCLRLAEKFPVWILAKRNSSISRSSNCVHYSQILKSFCAAFLLLVLVDKYIDLIWFDLIILVSKLKLATVSNVMTTQAYFNGDANNRVWKKEIFEAYNWELMQLSWTSCLQVSERVDMTQTFSQERENTMDFLLSVSDVCWFVFLWSLRDRLRYYRLEMITV